MSPKKPHRLDSSLESIGGTRLGGYWFFQRSPTLLAVAFILICALLLVLLIKL